MSRGFLIDMDGVIYRGSELIDGARKFVDTLREEDIPFLFLTNNSRRTRRDVATNLARLGIEAEERHVFTCAMATARFLADQKPGGTAYVIGEGGLLNALHLNGYSIVDHDPDYVVVGEGRAFNFEMIEMAVRMIENGAKLVATNLDPNCPTQHGIRPGCGAIVAMLETATGRKAFSVGKPSPVMMRAARKELGLSADETTMIGDTMETAFLAGSRWGIGRSSSFPAARGARTWLPTPIGLIAWLIRSPICAMRVFSRPAQQVDLQRLDFRSRSAAEADCEPPFVGAWDGVSIESVP